MSEEQNAGLISWWNEQSFPGRELFRLETDGSLILNAGINIRERLVANITVETGDTVIKNLLEKFPEAEARVKELEIEWLEAADKLKLSDKVASLKEHLQQLNALGDFEKLTALVRDWEHTLFQLTEENFAVKSKLAETAEGLAESEEWKEGTQAFKDIADKWKQAGFLDKSRNDKLWNRIEAARKKFNERKRLEHEENEKDLLINLDLKIDLVEQAEAIAASEEWKTTTETFHRLTNEWKTIGRTLNKKNEELWQRFLAAKAVFFEKKRLHFNKIQEEHEQNYTIKAALVEKAEALKDSTDWRTTAQAFATLMEEWKKTGRIPQDKGDKLWKQFNAAQDQFFEAKHKHSDTLRQEQEENYNLKKALLDRAIWLKNSNQWNDATAEYNELLDEWKKIGQVPREYVNSIWEEFMAARKHFFARKDANREQKKQYAEEQKIFQVEKAKGLIEKHKADLKEEHEKIADFKIAIENITPGKKAAELREHLEKLILESEKQVKWLEEKLELAGEGIEISSKHKE